MNYLEFDFEPLDAHQSEQLIALLNLQGFDGFEEEGDRLKAFIPESSFNADSFAEVEDFFPTLIYTRTIIEPTNWNQKWEEGFAPVVVDDFVSIRANFHEPIPNVQYEIVITPKMSFGTGHHATTFLMIQEMQSIDFYRKSVFDFGTGTGVLAILAEKMGAEKILAIDNDEWSIRNANENCVENECSKIILTKQDTINANQTFDIVLANINLNVIIANLSGLYSICKDGATILFSGILHTDEEKLLAELSKIGFGHIATKRKNDWILIRANKL
jgi:ribosomal protein L11 methyltransferase